MGMKELRQLKPKQTRIRLRKIIRCPLTAPRTI